MSTAVNDVTSNHLSHADYLLDAVPTGIMIVRKNGRINYVNAECARLFGYTKEEMNGVSVDVLLPERFHHNHANLRDSYFKDPSPRHMGEGREVYGMRKDGSEFPLEIGLRPLNHDNNEMVAATIVDISARKRADEQFSQVLTASPYGQLLIDDKGLIQLVNPALVKMLGYEQTELIGMSMDILLPERYRENHTGLRESYLKKS